MTHIAQFIRYCSLARGDKLCNFVLYPLHLGYVPVAAVYAGLVTGLAA